MHRSWNDNDILRRQKTNVDVNIGVEELIFHVKMRSGGKWPRPRPPKVI